MEKFTYTLDTISEVAQRICELADDYKIWLFNGSMGAGKTTLIKSLCNNWEVEDTISSPTYGLVNEYMSLVKGVIFHFDFYRLDSEEEALDIGADEYFYSGEYCFIEWSSKIPDLIPEKHVKLNIEIVDDFTRNLTLEYHG